MLGHSGDDDLVGGTGRTVLIGGGGRDRLRGGSGDDVLIGGSTNIDLNDTALLDVALEWNAADTYENRVAAVDALFTVADDGVEDKLTGSGGRDLFYDGVGDLLTDQKPLEDVL